MIGISLTTVIVAALAQVPSAATKTPAPSPSSAGAGSTTTLPQEEVPQVEVKAPVAVDLGGGGARPEDIERELLVKQLLAEIARERGVEGLDLPSIDIVQQEVESLRKTADGMASEGGKAHAILLGVQRGGDDLEKLGVSASKAEVIRSATDDVHALRAELALQKLRGANTNSGETLLEVSTVPDHEQETAVSTTPEGVVVPRRSELVQALRFPDRTITLLYRMADHARVIEVVERIGPEKVGPDSKYAYGAALSIQGRFDEARGVFATLVELENRRTIAYAAARQVERLDMLKVGAVDLPPLDKARIGQ